MLNTAIDQNGRFDTHPRNTTDTAETETKNESHACDSKMDAPPHEHNIGINSNAQQLTTQNIPGVTFTPTNSEFRPEIPLSMRRKQISPPLTVKFVPNFNH